MSLGDLPQIASTSHTHSTYGLTGTGAINAVSTTGNVANALFVNANTTAFPAIDLARLMERQLGYSEGHIDPVALRLFLRAYWGRVTSLAHAIHEDED